MQAGTNREGEGEEDAKALVGSEGGGLGARMAAAMLWCRWPALPLPLVCSLLRLTERHSTI